MDEFNPYAAPETSASPGHLASEADEGRGVWRDGKTLIMSKFARLPSRCVTCNAAATYRLKRSLYWHHPAWYLMLLAVGPIIYIIIASIIQYRAKIEVPLCEEHRARRSRNIQFAWLIALAGIAICFIPAFLPSLESMFGLTLVAGIVLVFFGLIFGLFKSQIVTPKKIDKTHVWLNKVSPLYLDELPDLPGLEPEVGKKPGTSFAEL